MPAREPDAEWLKACARAGTDHRDSAIAAAARTYVRERHLPRLLRITPEALADVSREGRRTVVGCLLRLARGSADAGASGHWSYDANRHIALLGALQAERAGLAALRRTESQMAGAPPQRQALTST